MAGSIDDQQSNAGGCVMWISLFAFVFAAAVGLSVAATLMQPAGQRTLGR